MSRARGRTAGCEPGPAWAKDRLPETYEGIAAYPVTYRRAIYGRLSAAVRSRLWLEQLSRYHAAHPGLSDAQDAVLAKLDSDSTSLTRPVPDKALLAELT